MKVRKVPMRTCVVTHEKLEKKELLRVVRDNEGNVFVDETGKANGRGAYICKNEECINNAKKRKSFERAFEINAIDEELFEKLRSNIIE